MRRLFALLALIPVALGVFAPAGGGSPPAHIAVKCGEERWSIKTLSDPRVDEVNFTPYDTSIGRLRNRPNPHTKASTPRLDGVETTTFRMKARLIEFKREDDRDIHLVVGVPSSPSKTMIVEFPIRAATAHRVPQRSRRWLAPGPL